jgi:hypothetical protein
MVIFLIYFMTPFNLPAIKLFYAKIFEMHLDHLPTTSKLGIWVYLLITLHSCQIWMKLEYSQRIVAKYSNIQLNEYPFRCSQLFHADRQTDMA